MAILEMQYHYVWYENGKIHRIDGPAIEPIHYNIIHLEKSIVDGVEGFFTGRSFSPLYEWFINGNNCKQDEYWFKAGQYLANLRGYKFKDGDNNMLIDWLIENNHAFHAEKLQSECNR